MPWVFFFYLPTLPTIFSTTYLSPLVSSSIRTAALMLFFKFLPLSLILFIADSPPSSATLLPRAFQNVHDAAVRHTKYLARDLRMAFGAVLITQPNPSFNRVVYCTAGTPSSLGGGGGSNTSTYHSSTPTGTSVKSSASPVPTSPWKLVDSHVSSGNGLCGFALFTQSSAVRK